MRIVSLLPIASMLASLLLASTTHARPAEDGSFMPALALLPTTGAAEDVHRRTLDRALRALLEADPTFRVQSARDTDGHIASLADLGVSCTPEDLACLQKLGILADVAFVLVPEAEGARISQVRLTLVDVESGAQAGFAEASLNLSDRAAVQALLQRVVHGEGGAEAPPPPPPDETPTAPSPPHARPPWVSSLPTVAIVAGTTSGVAIGGALICEGIFWSGAGPAKTRRDVIAPLGAGLWAAAIASAATAAAAVTTYFVAPEDPAPSMTAGAGAPPGAPPGAPTTPGM